jgi:hypothetical protein
MPIKIIILSTFLLSTNLCISQNNDLFNIKNNPQKIVIRKNFMGALYTKIYKFQEERLVSEISKRNFRETMKSEYIYNSFGKPIKKIFTSKSDKDTIFSMYSYDEKQSLKKITMKENNEVLKIRDSLKYDNKENIISYIIFYPDAKIKTGYLKTYYNFTYNNQNFINSQKIDYSNGNKIITEYFYNKNGYVQEFIVKEIGQFSKTESVKYTYKYDRYGNWVIKYVLINGKKRKVIKRKIKY